ncbi:putative inactive serine/threonine-protein kinase [Lachnellula hyalina]|uniref:Putative inactive serine/threonine-protein kinase n=1 Tax=Lachnellula hyalina TaxID=1316788 RepID=A0A8H8R245_9HELO|nr:putative inactive serine/threonine-protein kinase [Lachnellula hyalina]TVY26671.1 putative inactive serine/threonine-protein kinase [Lachnellula hyalina]
MEFFKSAVASAISKGPPFPYTFGDRVDIDTSIWTLYNGTKREDGSNCSIFSFDVTANKNRLPMAKNAVRKLRTLRHPGVIKVFDTVETESYIYIATERVVPLKWHIKRKSMSTETLKWGLFGVAKSIKFINDEASSVHGALRVGSLYTGESGEWKVGGFEVLSSMKDDEAIIYNYGSLVPDAGRYTPPELAKSGWDDIKRHPLHAVDAYNFGTLIFEVFNGDFIGGDQAGQTKNIPPTMHSSYRRLVNSNPKARVSVGNFLDQGQRNGGFFQTPLIKLTDSVDNLGMKNEEEREEFLNDLDQLSDDFPEDYFKMKILPELLKSVEFGGGGPKVFGVVMKISKKLSDDEFEGKITPAVIRLFGSPDRAIRVCLLDNLPMMIDRLPQKVVNDKIFPQMVTGFTDVAPVVREQTVKAVLTIIGKLSDRTINGELLKYLAKTSNDEQPGIRTNTTICLGKISKNLGVGNRAKVLIAAFTRSLRDPFVHARNAALLALGATADSFSEDDCANRILPAICPCLVDKEKLVRDQSNKTMDVFLQKIRKHASTMADTVLPPLTAVDASNASAPRMSTPQPNSSEAASWTGWAISSFTNKVSSTAGEMQSNGTTTPIAPRPSSVPATSEIRRPAPITASASNLHRQAVASPPATSTRTSTSSNTNEYFQDRNPSEEVDDAWGDMEEESFFDAPSETPKQTHTPSASNPFDDNGEPDFAGWLAAQSQKKPGSKPLPKGLAKPANGRPATSTRIQSTGGVGGAGAKKAAATAASVKPKPVVAKTIDTKPKETGDDEGWGDGW